MELPKIYQFPPFFTKQPNTETWLKQRDLWCDLLLAHHRQQKEMLLDAKACALFENKQIQRKLSPEFIQAVVDRLIQRNLAVSLPSLPAHQVALWWRTADEWADALYQWAQTSGRSSGAICTVYELLHEDEDTLEWAKMDPGLLLRILEILQKRNKLTILPRRPGAALEETGVKFA